MSLSILRFVVKTFKTGGLESLTGCHHSLTVLTVQEPQDVDTWNYLDQTWLSGLPCCIPVNVEAWVTIPGRDLQGDSVKLGRMADSLHIKSNVA